MRERESESEHSHLVQILCQLNELKDGKLAAFAIANAIRCLLALPQWVPLCREAVLQKAPGL